ncbi:MAG: CBS domain-containing protein [Candidatus Aenigmarchaeota archaeon]|nr:CBS domain-containing protein [Candidatus Aenigmarchaeota archaeon]
MLKIITGENIITGDYIRKLRVERGLSQTELARLAGISQAHVAKIENEKVDPRLSTVNKILLILSKRESVTRCSEIMSRLMSVKPETPVKKVITIMRSSGFSQVPVIEKGRQIGVISEATLLQNMDKNLDHLEAKDILDKPFPVVDSGDTTDILPPLLDIHPAVLVSEKGRIRGIITKSDLLGMK